MAEIDSRTLHEWRERCSNRGRWGSADGRGTLNFISRERVLDACAIPRSGVVISCALGPHLEDPRRDDPAPGPVDEEALEPGRVTRWGPSPPSPQGGVGEPRLASDAHGVIGRGVLLDFPRHRRKPWLDDDARIQPGDLDACAEAFGVTPESGDILMIRTGMLRRCRQQRSWSGYRSGPAPGLSVHCARWIHEREIALLAADTWRVEARPSEAAGCIDPLRTICLSETGLCFGEIFDLEELADRCAEDGRYAFLFCAAPLPLEGDRRPVAPLAIK